MSKHGGLGSPLEGIVGQAGQAAAEAVAGVLRAALPAIQEKVSSSSQDAVLTGLFGSPVALVNQDATAPPPPAPAPAAAPPAPAVAPPAPPAPADNSPAALPWEHDPAPAPPAQPPAPASPALPGISTAPKSGIVTSNRVRSLDNWRAWLHQVTPVIVGALVALHVASQDAVLLWVSLAFAVLDPLLSYTNATDKSRKIAYGVLGLLQSGGLAAALLGDTSPWLPVVSAGVTVVSSALARFYTPTTTLVPASPPTA